MVAENISNDSAMAGESPSYWKTEPKYIMNIAEVLERARGYRYLIKNDGLVTDPKQLQNFETRIVSDFVVDKCSRKISRTEKDTIVKRLPSLGVMPKRIIMVKGFFMWNILLPSPEDCLTRGVIIRTKHQCR